MRRIRIGPHELDIRDCAVVEGIDMLCALNDLGAPKQLVPVKGDKLLYYARKVDIQAAHTLLSLTEDERRERDKTRRLDDFGAADDD